ncbi:MAG TPA: DASS family sodium-coupled anion symporter [Myxococcota bacterium]|nr:DASS family sodium-coupled anion symporter [Myxococcota bacterium]
MSEPVRFRDLGQVQETLSAAELRFDRARRSVGLVAGPLAFALLLLFPVPAPSPEAARLAAILVWVLVWWVTEPVPIPVTSLLGPAVAAVCGVGTAREIFAPFGDPIVLFFLGSFLLAEAMVSSGLDRRVALAILRRKAVAATPGRLLVAFAALTAGISAWLNNTATTAMLYPIGLSVLGALARAAGGPARRLRFGTALMLILAWASSIGGIATPVGTAPNLITLGQLEGLAGVRIPFLHWMAVAVPIALAMLAIMLVCLRWGLPPDVPEAAVERALGDAGDDRAPLGRAERNVLFAFGLTVAGWVLPGAVELACGADSLAFRAVERVLPESAVAVLGAALLFVLPVDWRARRMTLSWGDAARIDWGTLLLFGGGLALGAAMFRTGLSQAMGEAVVAWTGARSLEALTFLFAAVAVALSETTSNTATATMLAPLAIAAAQAAGVSPIPPALGVALGSSMGFMLPVATPPNAIVYGSGQIPITAMLRHGAVLDLASLVVVPGGVLLGCRLVGLV